MAFTFSATPHSQAGPSNQTTPTFSQHAFASPSSNQHHHPHHHHRQSDHVPNANHASTTPAQFNILDWYPQFQSCHRYFLDHAQHSPGVQALAAFMNIRLPYQKFPHPVLSASSASPTNGPSPTMSGMRHTPPNPFHQGSNSAFAQSISLTPYLRRLIATGHDTPSILHGFFGDAWREGIGSIHEIERRNYLFTAKSASWEKVKAAYDMGPEETCPFLAPLRNVGEDEIQAADSSWSEWLAMQDWMLGPRAPDLAHAQGAAHGGVQGRPDPIIKREPR